ncbi:MAG: hypothetical protein COY42_05900 [Armatimonadetes bacterium CG_4_10_14_0_8_um_filter_66_14]|nr:hypothetical protein [Armatimonadota bacterium]OIP12197.1 MAG: hypothetical protein AUJ96_00760 [Armatimonadetes bacterium CG2_30_66_41]PIU88913.1 MAG: hypothetical protein COS65_29780 [Armatimonadetes bacterium CG06_land_8_20_14_3_00_66_21]PIW16415.1 MAG: hypothetical protein COW34_05790 [Armatimonadetes bacterium CG17_big_fil_post_rev_8_21_14_2_50_66_6]PIX38735.1 MAG: hypothetical protein COZ57_29795 [Armatimonadetes bacterium CG_4_8_14_3_um_filter_66_20]PIZ48674.1 MAG: hypothetical prote
MPTRLPLLGLFLSLVLNGCGSGLRLSNGIDRCRIASELFQVEVEASKDAMVRALEGEGEQEFCSVAEVWLVQGGKRFTSRGTVPRPHLHSLRSGPHLVELHLENLVLTSDGETWPGLGELGLFCHQARQ